MTSEAQEQPDNAATVGLPKSRGKLVKRVQALSQLTPSAALKAAILASPTSVGAGGKAMRRVAASDPLLIGKTAAGGSIFSTRLFKLLVMVVSLIAVLIVTDTWHQLNDFPTLSLLMQSSESAPAAPTEMRPEQTPVAAATPADPSVEVQMVVRDKSANTVARTAEVKRSAERGEPEPVQPAKEAAMPKVKSTIDSAKKEAGAASSAVVAAVVSTPGVENRAKAWLAGIEEMSKYPSRKVAGLKQLEKFEKAYPHYPVPEGLRAKLTTPKN